jgi:hypothetical protein
MENFIVEDFEKNQSESGNQALSPSLSHTQLQLIHPIQICLSSFSRE